MVDRQYLTGERLFGDDFTEDQIAQWYKGEEYGYYDLFQSYENPKYLYHSLNNYQAYRFLTCRYQSCLVMGCARGDDVTPIADRVSQFIAVEPAERWWQDRIAGTPARYMKPTLRGDIGLAKGSVDLVVCLGVLHHIPNPTHVFSEIVRILRPGGRIILREPISTMGDWSVPRKGLTANERGFPPNWFDQRSVEFGLRIARKRYCCFPALTRTAKLLGLDVYNNGLLVRLDDLLSMMFSWNLHYHRDTFKKKLAPGDVLYVFDK